MLHGPSYFKVTRRTRIPEPPKPEACIIGIDLIRLQLLGLGLGFAAPAVPQLVAPEVEGPCSSDTMRCGCRAMWRNRIPKPRKLKTYAVVVAGWDLC